MVNTSLCPRFTTSFKVKCKCGIYHLFPWVPRSYHYFTVFYLCNLPYQLFFQESLSPIWGAVHTYPDIFLKRRFSPPFSKQIRVHTYCIRIVFARPYKNAKQWKDDSIPHIAWVMLVVNDVLHHRVRKHPFSGSSTHKRVASVFRISTLTGERLWKDAF